jgi:hypothetical protein
LADWEGPDPRKLKPAGAEARRYTVTVFPTLLIALPAVPEFQIKIPLQNHAQIASLMQINGLRVAGLRVVLRT